ncbi:hypothetical protein B7P43_G06079 [Cryptotermes secundus]|uniref:Uncharacterized protein n=1 Tax=Cryptotermes secundus TaxID=105785 RepID=A0A2J7PKJ4_9NEOP|nr:hypothetical protein B7P43_G06079 [Cryptotermes secundus]
MDSEQLDEYLNGTYIPLDCHFIVARPTESGTVIFTEVYHIRRNQRLQKLNLGEWHHERGPSWTNISFYTRRSDLQGATLNAAVISGAICRITEFRNNKPVQVGGFFGVLWNALRYQLNFTSEFMKPPDGGYGSRGKNGWSGMIGMLVRKEAEVAVGAYVMTQLLLDHVHFVSPMGATKVAVFVRRPGPSFGTTWDTYMAPFSNKLWMAVLCAILGLSFGLTVTLSIGCRIGIEKNDRTTHLSLYDSFIYIFGSVCQQGATSGLLVTSLRVPYNLGGNSSVGHGWTWSWPCRLVFLSASLAAVVLLAAYSATFISFLTVRHSSLPFTTFEGILQDGTFKLGILERSVELSFFDTATETVMQNVYNKLILPALEDAPPDTLAGLQRVCDQPKYGFVVDSTRAYSVLNNLTCDIVALPEAFIPATGTFVVAKHSPYRRLINFK